MRAILLDWMVEVAMEFRLKRETFHLSAQYVDLYLSRTENYSKVRLQLLGGTALWVASKFEEIYPPKVALFVKATDNCYTAAQFTEMERDLFQVLDWNLSRPTLNAWANIFTMLWDEFCETRALLINVKFKAPDQGSYLRYREFMQVLDAALLDVAVLGYSHPKIVLAGMVVILTGGSGKVPDEQKVALEENFDAFCGKVAHEKLENLAVEIRYMQQFLDMPFSYATPNVPSKVVIEVWFLIRFT